jgi:hypothetical protein
MKNFIVLLVSILFVWAVILLAQVDQIIFSHQMHAEDVGAECADCHEAANTSLTVEDNLLPPMETCYNCHDEDETECTVCHTNPDEAGDYPRYIEYPAKFAHKIHIDAGQDCLTCHEGILEKEDSEEESHIPAGTVCTDCHGSADLREDMATCIACHGEKFNFIPENHTVSWGKDHGIRWQIRENSCTHCHSMSYCQDCHQGDNLDQQVHPLNYNLTHGLEARANKENCLTCHQEFQFCNDCHLIEMVMPRNHSYANWSNFSDGGMHAREAKYDFDYCQSCHSDAYSDVVCVRCHGM